MQKVARVMTKDWVRQLMNLFCLNMYHAVIYRPTFVYEFLWSIAMTRYSTFISSVLKWLGGSPSCRYPAVSRAIAIILMTDFLTASRKQTNWEATDKQSTTASIQKNRISRFPSAYFLINVVYLLSTLSNIIRRKGVTVFLVISNSFGESC